MGAGGERVHAAVDEKRVFDYMNIRILA